VSDAYLLQHVRADDEYGDHAKTIGIYSSPEAAKAAIERLKDQPGFRDNPKGFHIDRYPLDKDHWSEGFVDL
jgi:homoserine kinase type II